MYKIGFIDDEQDLAIDYKTRLRRKGIELCFVENCETEKSVIDWILKNGIKCMLVDYKLAGAYNFNGTDLIAFINSKLPDLPCIVLTSYGYAGIDERLVIENLFIEKEKLNSDIDSPDFETFIKNLKQAAEVFENRLKLRLSEFENLKAKKDTGEITASEEERLVDLFKLLRSYNEVDDLPAELLTTNAAKKMTDILQSLDELIEKTK